MTTKIPVECYSRVSGYFRPVQYWNKGKKSEFSERKYLKFDKEIYSASNRNFMRDNI